MEYAGAASAGFAIGSAFSCAGFMRQKYVHHRAKFSCILLIKGVSHLCQQYSDAKKYFIDADELLHNIVPNIDEYQLKMSCPTEKILLFEELNEKLTKLAKKMDKKLVIVSRDLTLLSHLHTKTPYFLCPSEGLMQIMAPMYGENVDEYKNDELKRMKYYEEFTKKKSRIILVDTLEQLNNWVKMKYAIKHKHYML